MDETTMARLAALAADGTGELRRDLRRGLRKLIQDLAWRLEDGDREDHEMELFRRLLASMRRESHDFFEKHVCLCECHVGTDEDRPAPAAEAPPVPSTALVPVAIPAQHHGSAWAAGSQDGHPSVALRSGADDRVPEHRAEIAPHGSPADSALAYVVNEFADSQVAALYLGTKHHWPKVLCDALLSFCVALLRIPAADRQYWLSRLQDVIPQLDADAVAGFVRDESGAIVPRHSVQGVQLDIEAPPSNDIAKMLGNPPLHSPYWRYGAMATKVLGIVRLDDQVRDGITDTARRLDRISTLEDGFNAYWELMGLRLHRLFGAPDLPTRLRRMVDLDEMLRCAVHLPVVAPDSWWEEIRAESLQVIEETADGGSTTHGVEVMKLSGDYHQLAAQGRCLGRPRDKSFFEPDGSDPRMTGKVAACLRLYLSIDDLAYPGRVIFHDH